MSINPESPILEPLRGRRGAIDGVLDEVREVKVRLHTLEQSVAAIAPQMPHDAAVAGRLDDHDQRLERIDRRLDLIDA